MMLFGGNRNLFVYFSGENNKQLAQKQHTFATEPDAWQTNLIKERNDRKLKIQLQMMMF